MGWNNDIFPLLIVVSGPPFTGLFVYSPAPGPGNLIASITAQAGTDPYGNAFQAGLTSYASGTTFAQLLNQSLRFATAQSVILATVTGGATGTGSTIALGSGTGPEAGAQPSQLTLGDSGAGGGLTVADALDGLTYGTQRKIFTAAGQPVNSLIAAPVNGITGINVAARKYLIRGDVIVLQGGTTANQAIQFAASVAVSQMNIAWTSIEGGTVFSSGVQGALGANLTTGAVPNGTTGLLHFDGTLTFAAAGTFSMEALCAVLAADTWTLSGNSYLELLPV